MDNNLKQVQSLGISYEDAAALRRISMTLRRWYEGQCGGDGPGYSWAIERFTETGKPYRAVYYHHRNRPVMQPIPDRERGAEKRLAKIMARYPHLSTYLQTDPRGCALHILRPGDVPPGEDPGAYYSRGIPVY